MLIYFHLVDGGFNVVEEFKNFLQFGYFEDAVQFGVDAADGQFAVDRFEFSFMVRKTPSDWLESI